MKASTEVAAARANELLSNRATWGTILSTVLCTMGTYDAKAKAKQSSSAAIAQVPAGL
ncbi:tRNA pseudouridine synthase TruB [Streptomyces sp. NBRC 110611]|nr:tRNA pseudouridine synthase TruB [Streptomyces sp. NBRC 110611]